MITIPHNFLSLYLVTDSTLAAERSLESIVEEAVKGGVTIVQLREKHCSTKDFIDRAARLKQLLDRYNIPLIINDRVDVALAVDAAGVHIGQSDMPYSIARRLLGKDKIIGLSVENIEQAIAANSFDVEYVAVSPLFSTPTKKDTSTPFGLENLKKVVSLTQHSVVAIGGINLENASKVREAGVAGIAVVSAIICADNPYRAAAMLCR